MLYICYDSKRGAWQMRLANDADEALKVLKRLRRVAVVKRVDNGAIVGGIEDLDSGLGSNACDRRLRWNWTLDVEACK